MSSRIDNPQVSLQGSVTVSGMLPRPRTFDIDGLRQLASHDLGPTQILCFTGRTVGAVESYIGAKLIDILDACGFSEQPRPDLKRCVVTALGHDGYQAIFSWNELFNSVLGEKVLVLYEKNGKPLDAHLGGICLISANDARLGPRHLRTLHQLTVQML